MSYIWEVLMEARKAGVPKKDIRFLMAERYSPYTELSNKCINAGNFERDVEINPYYRFYEIFKDLFHADYREDKEFRDTLFDIAVHFLAEIDRMRGMNKKEYYIRFILREIEAGEFGSRMRDRFRLFKEEEKELLALNILRLYETGGMLCPLEASVRGIFKKSLLYQNSKAKNELIFYIDRERSETEEAKLEFIQEMFLPVTFRTQVYWNDHFGIIGVDETMEIGNIAIY